ncbi:MAG: hypothetical protein V4760_13285 [Bdellovibrionota bacterium]
MRKLLSFTSLMALALSGFSISGESAFFRFDPGATHSHQTQEASVTPAQVEAPAAATEPPVMPRERAAVCEAIKQFPKKGTDKASFRNGLVSDLCRPFVKYQRHELDRCGDRTSDPYSSHVSVGQELEVLAPPAATETKSHFTSSYTWPSRTEMNKRGKGNLYTDAGLQPELPKLLNRVEELRAEATNLCCGPGDKACRTGMAQVEVSVCRPNDDPDGPDPCVFGGTFKMPGAGYDAIFTTLMKRKGRGIANELRQIAERNLKILKERKPAHATPEHGSITLSSYVSQENGVAALEPVILHEFGHACSMVKMTIDATDFSTSTRQKRALRATKWLDSAKKRCDSAYEIPEAQQEIWQSLGESKELAQCLSDLTTLNQKGAIDKSCNGLCAGHYLEESMGIAFSLLLGDVTGKPSSVFPNTCDHVRDGQHPLVSDVVDCLAQHSPRFREKIKTSYGCE